MLVRRSASNGLTSPGAPALAKQELGSNRRSSELLAGFTGCSMTIDRAWRITGLSPEAAAWFGVDASELIGADGRERLPIPNALFETVNLSFGTEQPQQAVVASLTHPGRWLEYRILPSAAGARVLFWDATDTRLAEEGGESPGGRRRRQIEEPVEEMALLDKEGVIVSVNAAWRAAMTSSGFQKNNVGVGASYVAVCSDIIPDLDAAALREAFRLLVARKIPTVSHAYVVASAAGPRWRQIRVIPLCVGKAAQFIAMHGGLTEVARAHAALSRTTEQLLSAQEEERGRIAVELHDTTGQHLAALGMGVARLRRLVGANQELSGVLEDMAQSVQEAHKEIRVLSYLLRSPSELVDSLETTVSRFVKGFGARTGLRASFSVESAVEATVTEVEHAALRVVQEALSNVYRHADATSVEVVLGGVGGAITVRVADDGKGIEPLRNGDVEGIPPGVGIAGMRARVEQLGGVLEINCEHAGTVVTATIPAPPSRAQAFDLRLCRA